MYLVSAIYSTVYMYNLLPGAKNVRDNQQREQTSIYIVYAWIFLYSASTSWCKNVGWW